MVVLRATLVVLVILAGFGTARADIAEALRDALEIGQTMRVVEVVDGDTVILENGRQVRLVGIQAPKLPLGRPGFEKWPLADEARDALERLVLGQRVTLAFGGQRVDRYDRLLAHLFTADGTWVQARMLTDGLARVYSFPDNRALAARMLAHEDKSRKSRTGIWAVPYYLVLDTEAAATQIDRFALVEGRVLDVGQVRGRSFLNFGVDWKTDFTVSIAPKHMKQFEAEGIAPEDYEGLRVRVRGWLRSRNGPMIDVTHPAQIEVLSP
jgi:micrococcal nuclease